MPIPGQQLGDAPCGMIGQSGKHIGKPRLSVDAVQFCGFNQGVDGSGTPAAFVGSREGPIVTANGNTAQGALGGVVGDARSTKPLPQGELIVARMCALAGKA